MTELSKELVLKLSSWMNDILRFDENGVGSLRDYEQDKLFESLKEIAKNHGLHETIDLILFTLGTLVNAGHKDLADELAILCAEAMKDVADSKEDAARAFSKFSAAGNLRAPSVDEKKIDTGFRIPIRKI